MNWHHRYDHHRRRRHEHPGLTRAQQHFAGVPITTMLQEEEAARANHHCHFLLLHFGKSWAGLRDAMSLAFHFARAGGSKWQRQHGEATEEDLLGSGAVGRFLRESGAKARRVDDVHKDEARHADALGAVHDEYERREKFLKAQSEEMARLLRKMEQENSWLLDELKELKVLADNEQLDAIRGEIQLRVDRIHRS